MNNFEKFLIEKATQNKIPINATIELTPICNMNCNMCYIRLGVHEVKQFGSIHFFKEWLPVLKQMKEAGVLFVLITGGEPLTHPDFRLLYETLFDMGFIVTINTNGTLITSEIVKLLAERKPRRVNVTMYGACEDTYERLCHSGHGFGLMMQGIRMLLKENVNVKINGTLVRENIDDLKEMLDIIDHLNVPYKIDSYMYPFYRDRNQKYPSEQRLSYEQSALADYMIKKHELGEVAYKEYRKNYIQSLEEAKKDVRDEHVFSCRAGTSSCWISWSGRLSPCVFMNHPSADVFQIGFREAWDQVEKHMKGLTDCEACKTCENRKVCQVCRACYFNEEKDQNQRPIYMCNRTEYYKQLVVQGE